MNASRRIMGRDKKPEGLCEQGRKDWTEKELSLMYLR